MGIRVATRLTILLSFILGLRGELIAQGGPRAPATVEHRVSVVVPVILSLRPPDPDSPDRSWRVRTNDPALRRRLLPEVRGAGDTVQVTIAPP